MSRFIIAFTALGLLVAASALWLSLGRPARAQTRALYIGGYTKAEGQGIALAQFDAATGTLSAPRTVAPLSSPSWIVLAPGGRTLYALSEGKDGGVSAFGVESDRNLRLLNSQPVGGGLTHLSVDATGKWLAAAAYGAGQFALFPLENDGTIGAPAPAIQLEGSGPNAKRQSQAHAHQAVFSPDNTRLWVADLGSDRLWLYDFDAGTGALKPSYPAFVAPPPGSGPRHLAFKAKGGFAYVVSELGNTVSVFEFANGAPKLVQTISSLPPNFVGQSTAAEIAVSGDGRFVYASNRGSGKVASDIAIFAVSREGRLSSAGHTETGSEPRHFALDPSGQWLLAANQRERAITVYRVDKTSGALLFHSKLEGVPNEPTCLAWGE